MNTNYNSKAVGTKIEFNMLAGDFAAFKQAVLSHWFESNEPLFTRHRRMAGRREYGSFESGILSDVEWVIQHLPASGSYYYCN